MTTPETEPGQKVIDLLDLYFNVIDAGHSRPEALEYVGNHLIRLSAQEIVTTCVVAIGTLAKFDNRHEGAAP